MDTFKLNGKKIVLYGAASIGNLALEWFNNLGFEVVAYIDKRGKEISTLNGIDVYSLDDDRVSGLLDHERYVLFVSVKNVFEHTNIANQLIKHGFQNIIYRPISVINGWGTDEEKALYDIYDKIENCENGLGEIELPISNRVSRFVPDREYILKEDSETVTFQLPITCVHTDKKIRKTPWFDKPVMALLPHIDLFRYVAGEKGYKIDRYIEYCISGSAGKIEITEAWKANVITNRSSVYEHMRHSFETERDFFVRNAPNVKWQGECGVFNLMSGKHRAAFFSSMRMHFFPVKCKKEEFALYLNEKKANEVLEKLYELEMDVLEAPIEHPMFYNYPCESKSFYYGLAYELMYYLSERLFERDASLSFEKIHARMRLNDLGFLGRLLCKAGCSVETDDSTKNKEVIALIGELLNNNVFCHKSEDSEYNIKFLDVRNEDINRPDLPDDCEDDELFVIMNKKQSRTMLSDTSRGYYVFFSGIDKGEEVVVIKGVRL